MTRGVVLLSVFAMCISGYVLCDSLLDGGYVRRGEAVKAFVERDGVTKKVQSILLALNKRIGLLEKERENLVPMKEFEEGMRSRDLVIANFKRRIKKVEENANK